MQEALDTRLATVRECFDAHRRPGSRFIRKEDVYFDVYERYLAPMRHRSIRFLEIGVQHGGSLQMWKRYLHPDSVVCGIDINPDCAKFEEPGICLFIGDQANPIFLQSVIDAAGPFDFILDDGSHIPRHQIASFEYLFRKAMRPGGVYMVEDCQTSYWPTYGGGLRKKGSFIEYAKRRSDDVNAWFHIHEPVRIPWGAREIASVEFAPGIVTFRRGEMSNPIPAMVGDLKMTDLSAPFANSRYAGLIATARKSKTLNRIVRSNPAAWALMQRFINR